MNSPIPAPSAFFNRLLFLAVLPVLGTTLLAQTEEPPTPQVTSQQSSEFKIALVFSSSFSPDSDLERGTKIGEVSINGFELGASASKQLSEETSVLFGLTTKYTDLEVSGLAPLPDQLQAIELSFAARRKLDDWFGPAWSGTLLLRTARSSDSSGLSDAKFSFSGGGLRQLSAESQPVSGSRCVGALER